MSALIFTAVGTPIPQGSARAFNNHVVASNAAKLRPWRATLTAAAIDAMKQHGISRFEHPVVVRAAFYFWRPQNHFRTGKNAHLLRDSAIEFPVGHGSGDLDKHQRALGDALQDAGVVRDDALIAKWISEKRWCGPDELLHHPGAVVHVTSLTPSPCRIPAPLDSHTTTHHQQESA